jgi:hypothetical protein
LDAASQAEWSAFFSVLAESAATLTGLVFVAVSLNLTRILATPGLTGRAAESVLRLFGAVLVSACVLIPRQPKPLLGGEILFLGCGLLGSQAVFLIHYFTAKTGHPRWWGLFRISWTLLANVPLVVAGVLLCAGSSAGLYWLAAGCMFSLISGVGNSWVLLIEILR